jgi:hypothetical protein
MRNWVSAVEDFSGAQIFVIAFVLLSLPIFVFLSLQPVLAGIRAAKLAPARQPLATRLPELATQEASGPEISQCGAGLPGNHGQPARKNLETVQISVSALDQVPANQDFIISVKIESLLDERISSNGKPSLSARGTGGALAVEVDPGTTLEFVLDCMSMQEGIGPARRPVTVYAPRQATSYSSQPVTAVFAARSKETENAVQANMLLWVLADGMEIGAFDFEVTINCGGRATAQSLLSKRPPAIATATLFRRALICSSAQDRWKIAEYIPAVNASNANSIEYRIADLSGEPQAGQYAPFGSWIRESDLVYVFWSAGAASSPAIHKQLELIRAEQIRRNFQFKPGQRKRLGICLVKLDNCLIEPPSWLFRAGGYFKNFEAFKASAPR